MDDVLKDSLAARKAIPDLGHHWPDTRLKALGVEVQAQYPELAGWPPYLAAEAQLHYASRFPGNPAVVGVRSVDFLTFLRAAIAGHAARH
ncbi:MULTISPECIES: hypothetical protein [unclassified Dyella]|uniref:hypothetical protein n=1 Tax=Dyella sp. ASV21 TaxID=2795114 RepID=UPI0018EADF0C|nr:MULTISPECIES: hypothetical protein [unclassified Dyella]